MLVDHDGRCELTGFEAGGRQGPAGLTPYQAPEVRDGMPVSPAGNLYAATAVFFECLTGLAPSPERVRQFRRQQLPASAALGQAIEPLCELMAWGMAGNRSRRPASAMDFVAELDSMAAAVYGPGWHERGRYALGDRVADALARGTLARGTGGNAHGGPLTTLFGGRQRSFYPVVAALVAVVLLVGTGTAIALAGHFGSKPSNSASGVNQGSPSLTPSAAGTSTAQLSARSPGKTAFTADAIMTPPATTSACATPATFRASGSISATTAGTVTYQWVYSSGTAGPVETLNFTKAGAQQVTGAPIQSKTAGTGWATIKLVSPEAAVSNKATYVLDCSTGPVTVSGTAAVTPAHSAVSCGATPPTATFTGNIRDTKSGPVTYYWALPAGNGPVQSLTFGAPGTEPVTPATVAASSDSATESGTLVVLSPVAVSSNTATFSVSCTQSPTAVGTTPGTATAHVTVQLTTNQVTPKTVPCGSTPPTFEVFAAVTPDATMQPETYHWVRPDGTTTAAKTIQLPAGTTGSTDDLFTPASDNFSGSETLVFTSPATGSWSLALALTCSSSSPTASASPQPLNIENNMGGEGSGEIGVPYTITDTPIGGTGPYTWSATGLPPGVTINASTGTISGTPTSAGGFSVRVSLTDSESPPQTAMADNELIIAYTPVTIAAVTLPQGTVGQPYPGVTFSASGGDSGPYSWFIQPDTSLPSGLTLSASGVLSGTPTTAGTYTIYPSVSDAQVSGAGFDKTELTLVISSA